ncbi:MAG: succinate dehydrogenase cytochrome b subunit [Acidobacteriota bacterium]
MKGKVGLWWTAVVRKFVLALTGLALFGFVCVHLAGNLLLLVGPEAFNRYADALTSNKALLYAAETLLAAAFLLHIVTAVTVTLGNWRARDRGYANYRSKGGPTRMNVSSRTMIWTGLLVLVFLVVHLWTFKYGPGIAEGYVYELDGEPVRDLYRLVVEWFQVPWYSLYYIVTMALLGFHLRHGFWSAFQSLGVNHPRLTPLIYGVGVAAAVILGFGFLFIPAWFLMGGVA